MPVQNRRAAEGAAYYPLRAANRIATAVGLRSPHRLRALILHDIPPSEEARFAAQLRWLSRRWRFVSPAEFSSMLVGRTEIRGANLLLTFDDGFASNRGIAERVLNPAGIKALFFVITDLLSITDPAEGRRYMGERLGFDLRPDDVPAGWSNLTWNDLPGLLDRGHAIGAHTATHIRLSDVRDERQLQHEIVESADTLARRLGATIDHFAFTYGDLASLSRSAFDVARQRFAFIHSGMRGDNAGAPPLAIRRDPCAMIDRAHNYFLYSNPFTGALLEGAGDRRHAADLARLDAWTR